MRGNGCLYKQAGSAFWWAKFYVNGKPQRESTGETDETKARSVLRKKLKEAHASEVTGSVFASVKMRKTTVSELRAALQADYVLRGKDSPQNLSHLARVERDFGALLAGEITPDKIDGYVARRLADGDKPASINRPLQLLTQAFALAVRRSTLAKAPFIRKLSEAGNARKVSVTEKQLADFLAALPDDGLRDFAEWSAVCAMRKGEASRLTWDMVNGEELRIPGDITKNREARVLPIFGSLATILERRKKARRMDCQYVFHRDGQPIKQFDKARRTAAKKANLPAGFVFHSLRSASITNVIHAGVSPEVALKLGGWKSASMLRRYCILTTDDLRDAITQTEAYRAKEAAKSARIVAMR